MPQQEHLALLRTQFAQGGVQPLQRFVQQCLLPGRGAPILTLSWSPDGTRLAVGSKSGDVPVWDPATGRLLVTVGDTKGIDYLPWSPDGKVLVRSGGRGVEIWEVATGKLLRPIPMKNTVGPLAFSPDGRVLAAGTYRAVNLIEVATGGRRLLLDHEGTDEVVLIHLRPRA